VAERCVGWYNNRGRAEHLLIESVVLGEGSIAIWCDEYFTLVPDRFGGWR